MNITTARVVFLSVVAALSSSRLASAASPDEPPKKVVAFRVAEPDDGLFAGGPDLIHIQARYEGSDRWSSADPETYQVKIKGSASLVQDPTGEPRNPFVIIPESAGDAVTVRLTAGNVASEVALDVAEPASSGPVTLRIHPDQTGHPYTGLGAGVMFYDNQFNISNDLFDWCFRDVDTQLVHALIRPDFEPTNDNDDWQSLNNDAFDWSRCERLFWILWNAKQRNPDLKVFACLYSPPPWMKTNQATTGDGGLKKGDQYRLEMAEYVYAFLKHAKWKGTTIDYLCLFNEPDWPHTQDGTHYTSLTELAETHVQVRNAIIELIEADDEFDHLPQFVFPETLGAGSITRAAKDSDRLADFVQSGQLDHLAAWGVHDYWNTGGYWPVRFQELRRFTKSDQQPIWMTEWAQRSPKSDLASAMEYGRNITNALRLGCSAWMAFEWAHPAQNQSGLISTQWGEGYPQKRFWRSKAYYVFQQIANTSPAGGQCVPIEIDAGGDGRQPGGLEALCVRKDDQMVVHIVNDRPTRRPYTVTGPGVGDPDAAWLTDHTNNFTPLSQHQSQGQIPPHAVLTLQYSL
ncbi:glycoside hydrolase [Crateriforma conspicua]|uniref:glycoside hydrolase n=1 Tax=Crateriforma conspicua TaxID=2527996 RepID=UPI0011881D07|nr:glycoside hydrolase [Crateriforma conspicua]QDV64543.1 O-Glycosyl hydrolase family 30 [Crateriforma conspicua]